MISRPPPQTSLSFLLRRLIINNNNMGGAHAAYTHPCVTSDCSALLTRHGLPCTTIDPRHPKLSTQQLRQIGFQKEWRAMLEAAPTRSPLCRQLLRQWLQTPPKYVTALLRGYDDKGIFPTLLACA